MDLPKYLYDYVSTSRTKTEQDHKIENLRKKEKKGKDDIAPRHKVLVYHF